jgi:septal ring factor EnvC (AmiA/AmiB activator)
MNDCASRGNPLKNLDDVAGLQWTANELGSELEATKTEAEATEDFLHQTAKENSMLKQSLGWEKENVKKLNESRKRSLDREKEKVKKLRTDKKNQHDLLRYQKRMTSKARVEVKVDSRIRICVSLNPIQFILQSVTT